LAGLIAVYNYNGNKSSDTTIFYLIRGMRMLQHRGKAYWKLMIGDNVIENQGSIPSDDVLLASIKKKKLSGFCAVGYLSKRSPLFPSMNLLDISIDGFLVDTEKLYLHPHIGSAKKLDPLYQIFYIFMKLITEKKNSEQAAEFIDRHLRGNIIIKKKNEIFIFRNSTGFKPLIMATDDHIVVISSENSLRISFPHLNYVNIKPGQLIKLSLKNHVQDLVTLKDHKILLDPFEFIRESHVSSMFNNKSIYSIRKNIGKVQADRLPLEMDLDSIYAEPDYTRPMALGMGLSLQNKFSKFEISEGVIKDRYDDSDHMIDFSEQVSKNKLLTTGKSLKFIIENLTKNRKIATIQGTIQTGSTARETIYYLKKNGVKQVNVIVCYVPTIDGRQVGLYTHNRDFLANKYVGKISNLDQLNFFVSREIGCEKIFYNSPSLLAKGIGIPESNLWFPEWIRFLEYEK
jgi:amidophosphoribosyltransferase